LPGTGGSGPDYSVQFLDPTQGLALWSQSAAGTQARIDGRVLEDHRADAAVTARADLRGVDAVYLSARKPVDPIAGAPPSRHHSCSAVTGTKRLAAVKQGDCAATDGDLLSPARLAGAHGKVVTGVVIGLGHAHGVALVVARGLAGSVVIELSTNGRTYHRVAVADASTIAVHLPRRPVARYVRVRSASGLDESLLFEVAVW
jgi:hypothetical protein